MKRGDVWFVIASGPSLTADDCDLVRGHATVCAINNAVHYAPWADYLYAGDLGWWREYWKDIAWFKGEKFSVSPVRHYGGKQIPHETGAGLGRKFVRLGPENGRNSGLQAINLAYLNGAREIYLLGHDGEADNGRLHFHDDHPHPLGNCGSIDVWPMAYAIIWRDLAAAGVRLVNCTRKTAHTIPHQRLEDVLEGLSA